MPEAPLDSALLERLAQALGDAFSGSELTRLLNDCGMADPSGEGVTEWRRLDAAFRLQQRQYSCADAVLKFVKHCMKPVQWASRPDDFEHTRELLNQALAFAGYNLQASGALHRRRAAQSHADAGIVSRRMHKKLQERGGHADVFRYCNAELVADDCFNAVFEAVKGMGDRVRVMASVDLDGGRLIEHVFESKPALVAFNTLRTESERNEQRGLANIMKGIFSAFRNPAAHEPKVSWHVSEEDALDLLSMLSLVHRRLDRATKVLASR